MSKAKNNNFKSTLKGSLILFSAGLIWGLHHVIVRNALDNITTQQLQLYQYFFAAVVLFIVFNKSIRTITKDEIIHGSIIGLVIYLGQMCQITATGLTSIGKVSFITALYVVLVPLVSFVLFKNKLRIFNIIAVILSVIGLYLITQASDGINKGDVLAFIGSIFFTSQIFFIDKYVAVDRVENLTFVQITSSFIYALIAIIIKGDPIILTGLSSNGWFCILYISIISTALAFFLQIYGQQMVSPQIGSVILTTEAPAATIFAAIFLGESISLKSGAGCILMLLAMILSQL